MTEDPARMLRQAALAKVRAECPEFLQDDLEVRIYSRSRKQLIALAVIPREASRESQARPSPVPVASQVPPPPGEDMGSWEEAILRVLGEAEKPLKLKTIARLAGKDPKSSYARKMMTRLIRQRLVYRPYEGRPYYWLTGRPLPETGGR